MNQHDDAGFFRTFGLVLGALVLFTVFIAVVANVYSPRVDRSTDTLVQRELQRQIAPVGQSRVAEAAEQQVAQVQPVAAPPVAAPDEATDTDAAESTESDAETAEPEAAADEETVDPQTVDSDASDAPDEATDVAMIDPADVPVRIRAVVQTNCAGCHRDGLYGAQRNDDAEAWAALRAKGLDTLTASVVAGKGAMPARADTTLSDDEIALAIQYMISSAAGDSAEAPVATETDAQSATEEGASDDTAAEESVAVEEAPVEEAATASEAATTTAAVSEIPANVKTVVDTLCAGCHISGVANAPKYGDKAAWDERLSMGMDKLLASAIAGKGAMPARGGSQLSDAELRIAIEYMATK